MLKLDYSEMARMGKRLGAAADQLPFIMATAMNDAAKETKLAEEKELDRAFDRPTPFTKKAFLITYARKTNLSVTVKAKRVQNEYLKHNVFGGTRKPKKRYLPVPGKTMRLNQYGNMPKSAIKRAVAKKNTFVGKPRAHPGKPVGVYQRFGKGGGKGKIKLIALFSGAQRYEKRYDFPGVFRRTIVPAVKSKMDGAVVRAMRSRRR